MQVFSWVGGDIFSEQKTDDMSYKKFTVRQKPHALNDLKGKALGTICRLFRHVVSLHSSEAKTYRLL